MSINDFKDTIKDLFPSYAWDIVLKGGALKVKNKEIKKEFLLSDQDFNEIYNSLHKNKSESNCELFYDNYYEVILIIDSNHYRQRHVL